MRESQMGNSASSLIYRIGRLLRVEAATLLKGRFPVVSPEQWAVLVRIGEAQPCRMGHLADPALGDHGNVTRLVTGLERVGLVRRAVSREDRRSRLVELTPVGEGFLAETLPEMQEAKERFFAGFGRDEVQSLVELLKRVESNILL